jgi:hypothetical protein
MSDCGGDGEEKTDRLEARISALEAERDAYKLQAGEAGDECARLEVEHIKMIAALEAENAKLKLLLRVAYDERNHWHDWFRRKERWANWWKAYAKKVSRPYEC